MEFRGRHLCDGRCTCPDHKVDMYYSLALDQHACPSPDCQYAHGYENKVLELIRQERLLDGGQGTDRSLVPDHPEHDG